MINNRDEYSVMFYENEHGRVPVREFLEKLSLKERAKILKYIEFLREQNGILDEPYSRHIAGKIRELRVDFGRVGYRIFYFLFIKKKIILLHAFTKNTEKTPPQEIQKAEYNMRQVIVNQKMYE
ncbi:MAG: type II toxin-antitoxin system RelE/ParE family toxin [Nanoarchaeota archaeon]|nr:type II toxin-antitoxin system RelE/ParE family toxin [Nanoarchaeota archaeon]